MPPRNREAEPAPAAEERPPGKPLSQVEAEAPPDAETAVAGTLLEQRHEATRHAMRWLIPNPRLDGVAADVAQLVSGLAQDLILVLGDGIELTAGLRKLREAKDCFVIQALEDSQEGPS